MADHRTSKLDFEIYEGDPRSPQDYELAELRARLDASQEALASALERLAAAEKVVSAARLITSPHGPVTGSRDWEMAWHQLEDALAAYQETSGETRS